MSNPRFVNKTLNLNYNTLDALSTYFENGGTITVCKQGRRSKANTSFPMIKGTIANRGLKQVSLTNSGVKAKG
jgi:hypothetical protein